MVGYLAGAFTGLLVPRLHQSSEFTTSRKDLEDKFLLGLAGGAGMGLVTAAVSKLSNKKAASDCGKISKKFSVSTMVGPVNGLSFRVRL